jgi:peptidoglycan/xylan/chitin deacetylase (PgdA/CDA1 family)
LSRRRIFAVLARSGLPALFRATLQRRRISVLVFHDLAPDAADRAFAFCRDAYSVIPLSRAVDAIVRKDLSKLPARPLVITFDDGLKSHYELLPTIRKHGVPVTMFICAGIVGTNRHFWFLHDSPLRDAPEWSELSHTSRLESLRRDGFRLETEYGDRQALSRAEIEEMHPFVDFQCHSMFHENLETCGPEGLRRAIAGAKDALEGGFGLTVSGFAFPSGDHTPEIVDVVRRTGYRYAVTNDPGFNTARSDPHLLKRIEGLGQGRSGTLNELIVRASGLLIPPKSFLRGLKLRLKRFR